VALEAMACGCVPLVARSGGLPDAVGEAGRVVAQGDRDALALVIDELLGHPGALDGYRAAASAHLERHGRDRIARDYLQVISDVCRTPSAPSPARAA
jgi:glycosyltransferase involved in cell wall biosynthesis